MPMILAPRCFHCGKQAQVEMTHDEVARLNAGMLIQNALPDWPAAKRELLITGTHPECWKAMFSGSEDD